MGIQLRLEEAMSEPPVATISYQINGKVMSLALRMPIVVTKFILGYACASSAQFTALWAQGSGAESQATFTTSRPLERASLEGLLGTLGFSIMAMDPNPLNIVAGTIYRTCCR